MAQSAIITAAALAALNLDQLTKKFRTEFTFSGKKIIGRAKYLVAIENKLPDGKSLRSYMNETFGEIDANAYKPARVFRELVALNSDGTSQESAGVGQILESHFDAIESPRVHIEASAILGFIAKKFEGKEEEIAAHKELLADILRNHKSDDETRKLLAALKATVKPEKEKDGESDGAGAMESEGKETKVEGQETAVATVTPVMLLDMLTGEAGKNNWRGIMQHAKENPAVAFEIAEKLQAIAENCRKAHAIVMDFIPAPVEQAA